MRDLMHTHVITSLLLALCILGCKSDLCTQRDFDAIDKILIDPDASAEDLDSVNACLSRKITFDSLNSEILPSILKRATNLSYDAAAVVMSKASWTTIWGGGVKSIVADEDRNTLYYMIPRYSGDACNLKMDKDMSVRTATLTCGDKITTHVLHPTSGGQPLISDLGRYVMLNTRSENLVIFDTKLSKSFELRLPLGWLVNDVAVSVARAIPFIESNHGFIAYVPISQPESININGWPITGLLTHSIAIIKYEDASNEISIHTIRFPEQVNISGGAGHRFFDSTVIAIFSTATGEVYGIDTLDKLTLMPFKGRACQCKSGGSIVINNDSIISYSGARASTPWKSGLNFQRLLSGVHIQCIDNGKLILISYSRTGNPDGTLDSLLLVTDFGNANIRISVKDFTSQSYVLAGPVIHRMNSLSLITPAWWPMNQ